MRTPYHVVDTADSTSEAAATAWAGDTDGGWRRGRRRQADAIRCDEFSRPVAAAVKCCGREYLRIIYGPEYTLPEHLETGAAGA
jgi:PNKP adenylyltransferase domain, ligase domain